MRAIVDPWPFAHAEVTVFAFARTMSDRFDDEGALHAALASAPYERLEWRLVPRDERVA
jgi:hypothetical protein